MENLRRNSRLWPGCVTCPVKCKAYLTGVCHMYPGMKCRFALAIVFREKRSFCPQKTQYRPILRGIFYDSSFFNNHLAWPDPIPYPKAAWIWGSATTPRTNIFSRSRSWMSVNSIRCKQSLAATIISEGTNDTTTPSPSICAIR